MSLARTAAGRSMSLVKATSTKWPAKYALPVLGKLPMEPKLAAACDRGAIELFEGGWLDGAADLIESLPQREL